MVDGVVLNRSDKEQKVIGVNEKRLSKGGIYDE